MHGGNVLGVDYGKRGVGVSRLVVRVVGELGAELFGFGEGAGQVAEGLGARGGGAVDGRLFFFWRFGGG